MKEWQMKTKMEISKLEEVTCESQMGFLTKLQNLAKIYSVTSIDRLPTIYSEQWWLSLMRPLLIACESLSLLGLIQNHNGKWIPKKCTSRFLKHREDLRNEWQSAELTLDRDSRANSIVLSAFFWTQPHLKIVHNCFHDAMAEFTESIVAKPQIFIIWSFTEKSLPTPTIANPVCFSLCSMGIDWSFCVFCLLELILVTYISPWMSLNCI